MTSWFGPFRRWPRRLCRGEADRGSPEQAQRLIVITGGEGAEKPGSFAGSAVASQGPWTLRRVDAVCEVGPRPPKSWSSHTAYSNPGQYRSLLLAVPDRLSDLCAAARNVIGHYRAELPDLPATRRSEIDSRWLDCILRTDQARHPFHLLAPRTPSERVAGCCRDHSLFLVGALRERNIPARTRVGFASYLVPNYQIDHVIVEFWEGGRWRRADPEIAPGSAGFDPEDMPTGIGSPFRTAAEAWDGYRRGVIHGDRHCVFPGSELSGPDLIRAYVILEVAHRYGDEMLLWDRWGDAAYQSDDAVIDGLTELLLSADSGDEDAENELAARYGNDARLHAGTAVRQYSPFGDPATLIRLR